MRLVVTCTIRGVGYQFMYIDNNYMINSFFLILIIVLLMVLINADTNTLSRSQIFNLMCQDSILCNTVVLVSLSTTIIPNKGQLDKTEAIRQITTREREKHNKTT